MLDVFSGFILFITLNHYYKLKLYNDVWYLHFASEAHQLLMN